MAWYGMAWCTSVYSLSISLSIRKMYGCEAYGGYDCSGSNRKMDGIHIYKMLVRLSLYRTMPSPRHNQRQRQWQKHRNILDGGSLHMNIAYTHIILYVRTFVYTYSYHIIMIIIIIYTRIFYLILNMCVLNAHSFFFFSPSHFFFNLILYYNIFSLFLMH